MRRAEHEVDRLRMGRENLGQRIDDVLEEFRKAQSRRLTKTAAATLA
jgi:hypothetical protein